MPALEGEEMAEFETKGQDGNLKWSQYAPFYDEMCTFIPAYQENIDRLLEALPALNLPDHPRILDLGAGTGNYILALNEVLSNASFVHLDIDTVMNNAARQKYDALDLDAEIVQGYIQRADFDESSFDLIICVNALCHAAPQVPSLRKIGRWLKPTGKLFVIDFGRPVKLLDWTWYIFQNAVKNVGLVTFLQAFYRNRQTFFQNRRAKKDQKQGAMWLHSPEEFQDVLERGAFKVLESGTCYRGYCDMAICTPTRQDSPEPTEASPH